MKTFKDYDEAAEHQLTEWVEGRPWHNPWCPNGSDNNGGECCPDFSCCVPEMIWARKRREDFYTADQYGREMMMLGALSGLVREHDAKVLGDEE